MKQTEYLTSPWRTFSFAIAPQRWWMLAMLVLIGAGNACEYSLPYFLKIIADTATSTHTPTVHSFLPAIIGVAAILLGSEVCFRTAHVIEVFVTTGAFARVTNDLFIQILKRPTSYFENRFSGDLGRRVQQVGDATLFFIQDFPWGVSWIGLSLIVSAVLLAVTQVYLLYAFLAWFVFFALTSAPLLVRSQTLAEEVATAHANLSGSMIDAFGNVPVVHSFGALAHEERLQHRTVSRVVAVERRTRFVGVANKFQEGISVVLLAGTLTFVSVYLFTRGAMTVGDFVVVAGIIPMLTGAVWNLGDQVRRSITHYSELSDAVQHLHFATGELQGGEVTAAAGALDLSFNWVTFRYPGATKDVFHNFSFAIAQGERVGIVGTSGAGKSTLVKLLLRQYTPQEGIIAIAGVPIDAFTLESLRSLISYVPQDTSLFHRTLLDNVRYARPEATKEEVVQACQLAHAHEFVSALPEGYDTMVGERGVKLSGGQRQRIALARAVLRNAPILILDEATSALDSESESLVQEGLATLFAGRTVVAIAHRLSTLREMDRIVVMEQGMIVESGSPQELLERGEGVFKRMWEHQKSGFIE